LNIPSAQVNFPDENLQFVSYGQMSEVKRKLTAEETKSEPGQSQELAYKCKFCDKQFRFCSALGGHISKAHPGLSEAYNHKKQVRETRELERELH
jgi:hypothetical protein